MAPSENHLIALLPRKDRLRLLASCESVELQLSDELATLGSVTRDAFFPVSGFISLVTHVDTHPGLEVGMVGSEGMLGAQLALGMTLSPLRALVQGPGSAWRIGAPALRLELANSAALQGTLNAYLFMRFKLWHVAWSLISRPLFLLSGVIFMYDALPGQLKTFLWYNPLGCGLVMGLSLIFEQVLKVRSSSK